MTAGHSCVSEDMKEILFTQRLDHLYPASAELLVAEFSKLFLNMGYKGGERERGGQHNSPERFLENLPDFPAGSQRAGAEALRGLETGKEKRDLSDLVVQVGGHRGSGSETKVLGLSRETNCISGLRRLSRCPGNGRRWSRA